MRIASFTALSLGSLLVAGMLSAAAQKKEGGEKAEKHEGKHDSKCVSCEHAEYKEAIPGVSRAVLSGDPEKGAYKAFTKFAPGVSHPMHSHPNEIWLVVLKGAYIQKDEKGVETRVEAGSAFHIPAGEKHMSSSDPKEGVVMFEESNEKFGMDPADKGGEKKEEGKEKKDKK
jgi:quercetin dioxygenase-like cupin family protein